MNRRNIALIALVWAAIITSLIYFVPAVKHSAIAGFLNFPALLLIAVLSESAHSPSALAGWAGFLSYTLLYVAVLIVIYGLLLEWYLIRASAKSLAASQRGGEHPEEKGQLEDFGTALRKLERRRRGHWVLKKTALDLEAPPRSLAAATIGRLAEPGSIGERLLAHLEARMTKANGRDPAAAAVTQLRADISAARQELEHNLLWGASGLAAIGSFETVHADERRRLGLDPNLQSANGIGLALSGGGIRAASFALGIIQVLLNEGILQRFDYLSTVSGGGYLGSSLSWWLHQAASAQGLDTRYEAFREQFGSKVKGARTAAPISPNPATGDWLKSNWLAYIRQHGNYLRPPQVGALSLVASILRVCLYSFFVYASATIGIFAAMQSIPIGGGDLVELIGQAACLGALALLVLMTVLYGPSTWLASILGSRASAILYRCRTAVWRRSGYVLAIGLAGATLVSIVVLARNLSTVAHQAFVALSGLGLGSIGAIYQFVVGRANSKTSTALSKVRIIVSAALLIYGLLVGAYLTSVHLPHPVLVAIVAIVLAAAFGTFVNLNFAGISRLYRDRLMEAFLPDLAAVANNEWSLATQANVCTVAGLAGRLQGDGTLTPVADATAQCQRPLQLINCNLVLIDSRQDLYRARGGDSFIISNRWSGSDATGWTPTTDLGDGAMSLATAMAISGAAVNPNAAPNGTGVTRDRLVSFLMSFFNVRLGYWMSNPKTPRESKANLPNFWIPGVRQGLFARGLHENARFVELSDGGHFDNTGIYELVRRRTKLIVACEAGQDASLSMDDLANAIEKVRVDFSVFIEFNDPECPIGDLRPKSRQPLHTVERGFAVGRVRYPIGGATSEDYEDGYIVYLQAVPLVGLPADVESYWRDDVAFPNDTTADQFFSERHLEAYRELGYAIASDFYREARRSPPATGYLGLAADILLGSRGRGKDSKN